jgi:alkylhydroperoxidase family enzyme
MTTPFTYDAFSYPVRDDIALSHRAIWERIAGPGSWWTGAQRVAVAGEVRAAREQRSDPPWLRKQVEPLTDLLPAAAVEVARRVAIDAHKLDRAWCEQMTKELSDAAYVELVAVVAWVSAIDSFADALGVPLEPLPQARAGEPDRARPDGMGDGGAWVPVAEPFVGPNVGRALSLVPGDHMAFMGLVGTMYALNDFTKLVWDRPLTRPQIELVAARVSAVNECFY